MSFSGKISVFLMFIIMFLSPYWAVAIVPSEIDDLILGFEPISPLSGNGSTITFVDSGVNVDHEVFGRFQGDIPSYRTSSDDSGQVLPTFPSDPINHGTSVASIALGNSSNYRGIAPNADLCIVSPFSDPTTDLTSVSDLNNTLAWILKNRQVLDSDILSISVGAPFLPTNGLSLSI